MVVKQFNCDHCGADGKITIKGTDLQYEDVVYCPVCSSDIFENEDFDDFDED